MRLPPNAADLLLRYLEKEWQFYDAVPIAQDDTLTLFDILLSIMLNSRLDTAAKVQSVWQGKAAVETALARIPAAVSLEDPDVPWEDLEQLFEAFCSIRHAGWAVATKILHKKRPLLIPIYDSVLHGVYQEYHPAPSPRGASQGQVLLRSVKIFREHLLALQPEIHALCRLAAEQGLPISPVRALGLALWLQHEPYGYYRERV